MISCNVVCRKCERYGTVFFVIFVPLSGFRTYPFFGLRSTRCVPKYGYYSPHTYGHTMFPGLSDLLGMPFFLCGTGLLVADPFFFRIFVRFYYGTYLDKVAHFTMYLCNTESTPKLLPNLQVRTGP